MSDEYERRIELATKIATLEERSVQNQCQLNRIETMLTAHAKDEEQILHDINKAVETFKDATEKRLDSLDLEMTRSHADVELKIAQGLNEIENKVDTKLEPIITKKNEVLGGWKVLATVATILFTLVLALKDWLAKLF